MDLATAWGLMSLAWAILQLVWSIIRVNALKAALYGAILLASCIVALNIGGAFDAALWQSIGMVAFGAEMTIHLIMRNVPKAMLYGALFFVSMAMYMA